MVRLTRIYTRGGDAGQTSLADGARVPKDDPRVEAYGTVDEANAVIGLARRHAHGHAEADGPLRRIQNDLFDLGADLATPGGADGGGTGLRVTAAQTAWLEGQIDRLNAELSPLDSFVLPGGSELAAWLHLARTVVRRAERQITALMQTESVNPEALRYCNRLSDYLFVLSRFVNERGGGDVLWVPGAHR
jgi:cob(I)alamin adenosyltransferase